MKKYVLYICLFLFLLPIVFSSPLVGNLNKKTDGFIFSAPNTEVNITIVGYSDKNKILLTPYLNLEEKYVDGGYKFGWNVTIPNSAVGTKIANDFKILVIEVDSNKEIIVTNNGFKILQSSIEKNNIITDEYIEYDFSDILESFKYNTTMNITGESVVVERTIYHSVIVNETKAIISFRLDGLTFSKGQNIYFDPTITLTNVSSYTGTKNNVTCEPYPFCHISVNDSRLRLYMPFDINTTDANTFYDYTQFNNDGVGTGDPSFEPHPKRGVGSLYLDGNDYLSLQNASSILLATNYTVAMWINISINNNYHGLICSGGPCVGAGGGYNWLYAIDNTNKLALYVGAWQAANTALINGQWTHVAAVANGTSVTFYLNGVADGTVMPSSPGLTNGGSIGAWGGTYASTGYMDEIMVFNESLSAAEIAAIYNFTKPQYYSTSSQTFTNASIEQNGSMTCMNVSLYVDGNYSTFYPSGTDVGVMVQEVDEEGTNTANTTILSIKNNSVVGSIDVSSNEELLVPAQNSTYVKSTTTFSGDYQAYYATNPALSTIDSWSGNAWISCNGCNTNQRFHVDLGSAKKLTQIKYSNGHSSGSFTTYGAKNFTLWGTNSSAAFESTVYTNDTDWTQLTINQTWFNEHAASNIPDFQYVNISTNDTYRYYALKFENAWGGTFIAVRRIAIFGEQITAYNISTVSFNISNTTYYPNISFYYYGNTNNTLSPFIKNDIVVESYDCGAATPCSELYVGYDLICTVEGCFYEGTSCENTNVRSEPSVICTSSGCS